MCGLSESRFDASHSRLESASIISSRSAILGTILEWAALQGLITLMHSTSILAQRDSAPRDFVRTSTDMAIITSSYRIANITFHSKYFQYLVVLNVKVERGIQPTSRYRYSLERNSSEEIMYRLDRPDMMT